jgi:hypothetical protein
MLISVLTFTYNCLLSLAFWLKITIESVLIAFIFVFFKKLTYQEYFVFIEFRWIKNEFHC